MMISERPDATASSTTYWIIGLSTSGSISFGWAFVAGRNRVPSPAAGNTALRTLTAPSYPGLADGGARRGRRRTWRDRRRRRRRWCRRAAARRGSGAPRRPAALRTTRTRRSEERRVGKECRERRAV